MIAAKKSMQISMKQLARIILENAAVMFMFKQRIEDDLSSCAEVDDILREIAQFGQLRGVEEYTQEAGGNKELMGRFARRAVTYAKVERLLESWIQEGVL